MIFIQKAKNRLIQIAGQEPVTIYIPLTKKQFQFSLKRDITTQVSMAGYNGKIKFSIPGRKFWKFKKKILGY